MHEQKTIWRYRWRWWIWNIRTIIQWLITGQCGNNCGYEEQFDCFVPEAECAIHDGYPKSDKSVRR